jgi:hypothetical protein
MSKSVRGGKGPGYEYWSKRPNKYASPGKSSKIITHRVERRQSKDVVRSEVKDL